MVIILKNKLLIIMSFSHTILVPVTLFYTMYIISFFGKKTDLLLYPKTGIRGFSIEFSTFKQSSYKMQ